LKIANELCADMIPEKTTVLKEFLDRGKLRGNHPFQTVEIHVNQPGNQIQMEVDTLKIANELCADMIAPCGTIKLIAS
jgi:hypothetical protein